MESKRQKELLEILSEAVSDVEKGDEISTEFARVLFPPKRKEYELTYFGKKSKQSIISQTLLRPFNLIVPLVKPDKTSGLTKSFSVIICKF